MKRIVDIPDEIYDRLKSDFVSAGNTFYDTALNSIIDSVPFSRTCNDCKNTDFQYCRNCVVVYHSNFR